MTDVEFPQHLLGASEQIGEVEAPFYQWLAHEAGPDDCHRFALEANWDTHGSEVYEWIAQQPDCDRATALALFWKASPDYAAEFPDAEYENRPLIQLIRDRWLNDGYARGELAFDPEVDAWPPDLADLRTKIGDRMEKELPSSMRTTLPGRRLESEDLIEGIPSRFWPEELR